jgi:hypothetical protein
MSVLCKDKLAELKLPDPDGEVSIGVEEKQEK